MAGREEGKDNSIKATERLWQQFPPHCYNLQNEVKKKNWISVVESTLALS